jgi:hypothetical protein
VARARIEDVMTKARAGRCWYCGDARLRADDPPEHVIADALGGTLKTDRVCRGCNERAGRQIDWPFQNDWLIAQRQIIDELVNSGEARSKRGRTGRAEAHQTGDPETLVDIDRNWRPTVRSKIERTETGARIWASSEHEAQRLRERLVKQLAADGLRIESEEMSHQEFNDVTIHTMIDGVGWLRAAAKMALGTLSLVLDESWLDTDGAKRLRQWLWADKPPLDDGSPAFVYPEEPRIAETLIAEPPTHLITLMPITGTHNRVLVSVGLFGAHYLRIGIQVPEPRPDDCWVMVRSEPVRTMKWHQLLQDAAVRMIERQEREQATEPRSDEQ